MLFILLTGFKTWKVLSILFGYYWVVSYIEMYLNEFKMWFFYWWINLYISMILNEINHHKHSMFPEKQDLFVWNFFDKRFLKLFMRLRKYFGNCNSNIKTWIIDKKVSHDCSKMRRNFQKLRQSFSV